MSDSPVLVAVDSSRRTAGDYGTTANAPVPVADGVRCDTTVQQDDMAVIYRT